MSRTRSPRLPLALATALALSAGAALAQGAGQADPHGHGGPAPPQGSGATQAQPPAATVPQTPPQAPPGTGGMMMRPQQMQDMHRGMAQGGQMPMGQMPAPRMAPGADRSPAAAALMAITERMHRDMAITLTGDADRDFAAAMIPHHQSAIEMARVVLQHGRDPEIRKLAEDVVREQEREIAQLRAFLARQPR